MPQLDTSVYDLKTVEGQSSAIQDIVSMQNDQFDNSASLQKLSIAAFGSVSVQITQTGVPIQVFQHNLGYAPIFKLFNGELKYGSIFDILTMDVQTDINNNLLFVGTVNGLTDMNALYVVWNDQLQTRTQEITYIIFSVPIAT